MITNSLSSFNRIRVLALEGMEWDIWEGGWRKLWRSRFANGGAGVRYWTENSSNFEEEAGVDLERPQGLNSFCLAEPAKD